MDNQTQTNEQAQPATEAATAAPTDEAKKPEKKRKSGLLKREDFLVQKWNEGITDFEQLGKLLQAEAEAGRLRQNPAVRKVEASLAMWVAQAKWYLHHAEKKGKLATNIVRHRKPRAKKEKAPEAATSPAVDNAGPAPAAAEQEIAGTL